MVNNMKKTTLITIYNTLTVIFALMTIVSMGSALTLPMQTVLTNTALFALLTYTCVNKENRLRARLKRKHRKAKLSVYRGGVAARQAA